MLFDGFDGLFQFLQHRVVADGAKGVAQEVGDKLSDALTQDSS